MNNPVVKFRPEDEEVSIAFRQSNREGTRFIIPALAWLFRGEIEKVGLILIGLGEGLCHASKNAGTLTDVILRSQRAIIEAKALNVIYRRKVRQRRRNYNETAEYENY